MKMSFYVDMFVIFLGVIAMYTPWLQLKHKDGITGKALSIQYPQHEWMRWGFASLYIATVTIVFYLGFQVVLSSQPTRFTVIGGIFACIGLFGGSFAVITDVCCLPMRVPWMLYVVGGRAREAGRFQVAWSLGVLVIVLVLEIIHRI